MLFNNKLWKIVLLALLLVFVFGCDESDSDDEELVGNWFECSDYEGVRRSGAVSFVIDGKAYVGLGYDGRDRLNDFWMYDPDASDWFKKASFPGAARSGAVAFATDTKAYVGTGYDGSNKLKDFWEFDPSVGDSGAWTQVANFAGSARYSAVAFTIDNIGYVGTGYDGNALKDLWKYEPSADQWTEMRSLHYGKRQDAVAFSINQKGYICTGIDNGSYEDDFEVYDPVANTWTVLNSISDVSDDDFDDDYTSIVGIQKVAFSINGKGYIASGGTGTASIYVWEYDPAEELWTQKTSLESADGAYGRIEAVGFSIGDYGYITTGKNSSYYFDDLWGFDPIAEQEDGD